MLLTPVMVLLHDRLVRPEAVSEDGMERPDGLSGTVLVIGFGRFSQIVSQPILARGYSISLIDTDPAMIRAAASFGFKVYYGDGTRLDILHAAGAGHARAVVVGIDDKAAAIRIVELLKAEFPMVPVLARAFDRAHEMELIRAGADEHIRETFESALTLGARSLSVLGEDPEVIDEVLEQVRRRDAERFARQFSEGIMAGQDLLLANSPKPETA
jgi:CPA2 family monovalent cation:H+ antiporter-2/glutathione-regulated potassium-efflux system protein KefB